MYRIVSYDRLISTVGFPILVKRHLYIESGPRLQNSWWVMWQLSHRTCGSASLSNTGSYNKMSHSFQAPIFIFKCPIALLLNDWMGDSPVLLTSRLSNFRTARIWKPIPWPKVFLRSRCYSVFRILKHGPGNYYLDIWVVLSVRSLPMCSCSKGGQLNGFLLKISGHWLPWLVVSLTVASQPIVSPKPRSALAHINQHFKCHIYPSRQVALSESAFTLIHTQILMAIVSCHSIRVNVDATPADPLAIYYVKYMIFQRVSVAG